MNKANKRTLILSAMYICALILFFAFFNIANASDISESDYIAQVGSVKYKNAEEAWNAVSNGGTVTMLGDWTINDVLTVNEDKSVTVNMNGFMINRTLTGDKRYGQIFLVESNATLNVIGMENSEIEHKGTIQNDTWHYNSNGNHIIKGALITGGYNSNGGGAIHIQDDAQVTIKNVTIAGNISTDGSGAGAIRVEGDNSKLTIIDSEICYNKATYDDGGAIVVNGEDADVQIKGTKINNNIVTYKRGNGGAIQINYGRVTISDGSEISFNTTAKNGGAIYVSDGDLILDETTIVARNTAGNEGGAIYVDSGADVVLIEGIFSGNSANEEGGAIYVNSNVSGETGAKISNAEFLGNRSNLNGGAIFVDSDDDISLSGKVIANGNSPNNLYIQDEEAIVQNTLTEGSSIGITTSWDLEKGPPVKTSNYMYFVSDLMEYCISGDSTSFYYSKIKTGAPDSITVGNNTYPVIKGTLQYSPNSGGQLTAYFYYSDGYFVNSAKYYNEHLSTLSSSFSVAAVNSVFEGEYTEGKGARNIIKVFEEAGFKSLHIHYPYPEFFGEEADILSTIGYIIGSKQITVDGESVTLIAIAVRGGKYGAEWASNVVLGDGIGEAKGFDDAADQVEKGLYKYLNDYEIDPTNAKFWITGFSRAAATSNLVAKRLTDKYGEDDIYAYCFETPKGGVHSLLKDGLSYSNIHNVINRSDIVPLVGTTEMGFIRYGVDHMLPSYEVGTDEYNQLKAKMLIQLASIAPDAVFNDYFHEATLSYILFTLEGFFSDKASLIKEETFPEFYTASEWIAYLINRIQQYSLTNNVSDSIYNKDSLNWHGYRNYWSSYKWYLYKDESGNLMVKCYGTEPDDFDSGKYTVLTLEKSVYTVLSFYFSMDDDKKDAIINAIDMEKISQNIEMKEIYSDIIGEWNGFNIEQKNTYFNKLWNETGIEESLKSALTSEEIKELKNCLFVLLDFGLDLVSDDYDFEEQDLIGGLIYNISSIMQTHNYEILCAWTRSYDSFYASGDLVSPPISPSFSLEGGIYNDSIVVQLTADNKNLKIYYTLDGTTPSAKNGIEYSVDNPIRLDIIDSKPTTTTIKAICVYNGLYSEVVTYTYTLNSNAEIAVYGDIIHVYNFEGTACLVLAEYESDILRDIEYFTVTNNYYLSFDDISLNFDNKVVAYLIRDFATFTPLCDFVCINDSTGSEDIETKALNYFEIKSFKVEQGNDPEFINVTFTTSSVQSELFIVALYEKNAQADLEGLVYFNGFERNENDEYTFTIERARLKAILGDAVNNSTLRLTVQSNGVFGCVSAETVYKESVYYITYNLNGGTNNDKNRDVFTVTDDTIIYNPYKEHYNFLGWYDNPYFEGSDIWVIPAQTHGNVELYAKWEIINYFVLYRDGVEGEDVFLDKYFELGYGSKTPEFGNAPTREGYTFIGWDKEISPTVEKDTVYNAVWQKNHVHTPILVKGTNATCHTPGYKSYYECVDCGYFEEAECITPISNVDVWKQTNGKLTKEHTFTEKAQTKEYIVIGTGITCLDAVRYYYGCANCDAVSTEEWSSNTFGEHNIDTRFSSSENQHYHKCLNEGCDYTTKKVDCFGGISTCKEKAICVLCQNQYGTLAEHISNEDDGNCTTAIVCQSCGEETTPARAEHTDSNADNKCDFCEYIIANNPDIPQDTDTDTTTDTDVNTDIDTDTNTDTNIDINTDTDNTGNSNDKNDDADNKADNTTLYAIISISLTVISAVVFIILAKLKIGLTRKR